MKLVLFLLFILRTELSTRQYDVQVTLNAYINVSVLCLEKIQIKASIQLGVAKSLCSVTKEYGASKKIQNTITVPSQLSVVKDPSCCKEALWTKCEAVGCPKFIVVTRMECSNSEMSKQEQARIVGGTDAVPNEFPYQATFLLSGNNICGGTILDPRHILTAAHCLPPAVLGSLEIRVGDHSHDNIDGTEQYLKPESYILHGRYDDNTLVNDIAIIKLEKPMCFNDVVKPAILPQENKKPTGEGTVTGWGRIQEEGSMSDILKKLTIPILPIEKCKEVYAGEKEPVLDTHICAGLIEEGGQSPCQGDSGGPFARNLSNGFFEILGIQSWIGGCGRQGVPLVLTDVSKYVGWIRSNMH